VDNLNSIVAANIAALRKEKKLTQLELAEKLNYSDKAVSKWERGESLPSIDVLCELSALFEVSLDYITGRSDQRIAGEIENKISHKKREAPDVSAASSSSKKQKKKADYKLVVPFLSVSGLWFIMITLFVCFSVFLHKALWSLFYWALPGSALLLLIFNCIWGKKKYIFYLVSFIVWTIPLCACLQFIKYDIWILMSIVIPLQIAVLLCLSMSEK